MIRILFVLAVLVGCSKQTPTTAITETTKKEIVVLQKDIEYSTCDNKKDLISKLDNIKSEVNNILLACNSEKKILEQTISKLRIVIMAIFFCSLLFIAVIMKKK